MWEGKVREGHDTLSGEGMKRVPVWKGDVL